MPTPLRVLLLLLAGLPAAHGVIVIGPDDNLTAPSNGAPWQYVARVGVNNASGVYLGNRFVLTANHVTLTPEMTVLVNGVAHGIDPTYSAIRLGGANPADAKVFRLATTPASLGALGLISGSESAFNKDSTLIGWGVGKGSEISNQGWNWAGDASRAQRWGLNRTAAGYTTLDDFDPNSTADNDPYLVTDFDRGGGADEAATALGDSGSGLFQLFGSQWKLVGITSRVTTGGASLYDRDVSFLSPGDQPDMNFFVPIQPYLADITAAMAVPEPGVAGLLAMGLACLARRRSAR